MPPYSVSYGGIRECLSQRRVHNFKIRYCIVYTIYTSAAQRRECRERADETACNSAQASRRKEISPYLGVRVHLGD